MEKDWVGGLKTLKFRLAVGKYLRNSPPKADLDCLKDFVRRIRGADGAYGRYVLGKNVWISNECNHIIVVQIRGRSDSGTVVCIRPDATSNVP